MKKIERTAAKFIYFRLLLLAHKYIYFEEGIYLYILQIKTFIFLKWSKMNKKIKNQKKIPQNTEMNHICAYYKE